LMRGLKGLKTQCQNSKIQIATSNSAI